MHDTWFVRFSRCLHRLLTGPDYLQVCATHGRDCPHVGRGSCRTIFWIFACGFSGDRAGSLGLENPPKERCLFDCTRSLADLPHFLIYYLQNTSLARFFRLVLRAYLDVIQTI